MSEQFDKLKACGIYTLITMNGDYPAGRPFGSLVEIDGKIYFNTTDANEAHKQLRANPHMQIVARKPEGFGWIRATGLAKECHDDAIRHQIHQGNAMLKDKFQGDEFVHFLVFEFQIEKFEDK